MMAKYFTLFPSTAASQLKATRFFLLLAISIILLYHSTSITLVSGSSIESIESSKTSRTQVEQQKQTFPTFSETFQTLLSKSHHQHRKQNSAKPDIQQLVSSPSVEASSSSSSYEGRSSQRHSIEDDEASVCKRRINMMMRSGQLDSRRPTAVISSSQASANIISSSEASSDSFTRHHHASSSRPTNIITKSAKTFTASSGPVLAITTANKVEKLSLDLMQTASSSRLRSKRFSSAKQANETEKEEASLASNRDDDDDDDSEIELDYGQVDEDEHSTFEVAARATIGSRPNHTGSSYSLKPQSSTGRWEKRSLLRPLLSDYDYWLRLIGPVSGKSGASNGESLQDAIGSSSSLKSSPLLSTNAVEERHRDNSDSTNNDNDSDNSNGRDSEKSALPSPPEVDSGATKLSNNESYENGGSNDDDNSEDLGSDSSGDRNQDLNTAMNNNNNNNSSSNVDGGNQNNTNGSICDATNGIDASTPSLGVRILFFVLYSLVFVIGSAGNALTIYAMLRKGDKNTVINIFIANLALSDIMLCIFAVPITPIYSLYYENWVFGISLCKMFAFAMSSSVYISTFTMINIAFLRYRLIVYPHLAPISNVTALKMNLATWILGFIVTFPYVYHVGLLPAENCSTKFCDEQWAKTMHRFWFSIVTLMLQFFLPFIAVSYFYGSVFWKLHQQRKLQQQRSQFIELKPTNTTTTTTQTTTTSSQPQQNSKHWFSKKVATIHQKEAQSDIEMGVSHRLLEVVCEGANIREQHHSKSMVTLEQPTEINTHETIGQLSSGSCSMCGGQRLPEANFLQTTSLTDKAVTQCEQTAAENGFLSLNNNNTTTTTICHHQNKSEECAECSAEKEDEKLKRTVSCETPLGESIDLLVGSREAGNSQQFMCSCKTSLQIPMAASQPVCSNNNNNNNNNKQLVPISRSTNIATSANTAAATDDIQAIRERRLRERNKRHSQTNRKLVFMVVLFVGSWLPLNSFNLIQDYQESLSESPYIKHYFLTVHVIACSSVCYNPLLYAWMSDNYHQELRDILPTFILRMFQSLFGR